MAFVQLSGDGKSVAGIFGGPQTGNPAFAEIDDADPRLAAFYAAKPPTLIPFTQFVGRMTQAQQIAVAAAAQSNPQLLLWFALGAAHGTVDLTDPATAQGLQVLVGAGILTQAQVTALLTP